MVNAMHRSIARRPPTADSLLDDVVGGLWRAPVREELIRDRQLFVFGDHEPSTGLIRLNVPLLRVMVFLHEGTHRARPTWDEQTVRRRSSRLLHALDDDDVAELDAQLVAAIAVDRHR